MAHSRQQTTGQRPGGRGKVTEVEPLRQTQPPEEPTKGQRRITAGRHRRRYHSVLSAGVLLYCPRRLAPRGQALVAGRRTEVAEPALRNPIEGLGILRRNSP